ncbi:EAL domain-containing protein [Virgibacillus ndiopensis]|uniref:EAL domain-containing protein n=1 Tax=Virgibacillus ndiopensis TaxID=2004408 RepID=UPI000C078E98|nr:EAL domain-containing protein [Virgibacillus ndiopensis]
MSNVPQKKSNFLYSLFKKNHVKDEQTYLSNPNNDVLLDYYSSLANYHPDLIIVLSLDGEIISQNRGSINEFLGYHPDDTIDYRDFVPGSTYKKLRSTFFETIKNGTNLIEEVTVKNKYDQTLYIVLTFIPIKKTDDDVEGIYIIVRDNTNEKHLQQELELKEKHLTHAQQITRIGSWEYLIEEDTLYCSDYFYDIFGIDKPDFGIPSMETPFKFVHPDDKEKIRSIVNQSAKKGIGFATEFRVYHGKSNEIRYIKVQAESIWQGNKPYKLVGVVRDYTTQQQLEIQMEETYKNFQHIFDNLNAGIWLKDYPSGNITYVSKGLEAILQYPLERLSIDDSIWKNLIFPADREDVFGRQELLKTGESLLHRYRIVSGDGTTKWVFDQTVPWFNEEGELTKLFGMLTDITPEVEMQEQLDYFATHDTLTALPNQRSLYNELDDLCGDKSNFSLLYLDLDRFKLINDSLGYHIGDEVLKLTANRLLAILPDESYFSRISSNDFIALVKNFDSKNSVFNLAEKIIEEIEKPLSVEGYDLNITTSIGISFFPDDGDNKLTLIENAHAALYHAKHLGKNNYQFYSFSRDISSYKKFILEKDMRKAIVNEEFEVYYQPRVSPASGVIQGAEALIRWNHEEWGLVSPGEFIPLAEENHLVNQIGDWVIKRVCAQLHTWKSNGVSLLPISINISPQRFLRKGLVELIEEQLNLYNIPAKYLEFEITESSLLKNEKTVLATMNGLKKLGVKVAIDDFGTGYASLSYLREFHADTIKIDQVFIKNIQNGTSNDAAIISSILHLSKGIGVKVVAEGVEEYDQLEFLKQKECDEIQGYLFSQPVPEDTFLQMLQTGYIKPTKPKVNNVPDDERRNFYRVSLPFHVIGEMSIVEVNKRKVNLGSAQILIEDISLGGIKILSSLKLPVNSAVKFKFTIVLMGVKFKFDGDLVWKNKAKGETFYYGINFNIGEVEEDKLAEVINKMTVLQNLNQEIPDTPFVRDNPYVYLHKYQI